MQPFKAKNRWLFTAVITVYVIMMLIHVFSDYTYHKDEVAQHIDDELYKSAAALKYLLPVDLHDRAIDEKAVSIAEDKYLADKLTAFVKETGFKYAYTLIKKEGKLFFIASDLTANPETKRGTFYFYPYEEADESFHRAFDKTKATYKTVSDQWGTVRTVMVPERSPGGIAYLSCVDYDISNFDGFLQESFLRSIAHFFLFFILSILIILLYTRLNDDYVNSLKESEEKYKSLANNLNMGIYRNSVGSKGRFIEANPAIVKMFGFDSKERFLEMNVSDLYQNPEERKKYNTKLLSRGSVRNEELQLRKNDGTSFIGSVSAVVVPDDKGEIRFYDGVIEDITERKWAESALRESEEEFRHLFENAMVGMYRTRIRDGKFLAANKKLADMLGYATVETLISEYVTSEHYRDPKRRKILLDEIASGGRVDGFEIEMERADGTPIQISLSATAYTDCGYLEGVIIDITDRVKAEAALRESEARYRGIVEDNTEFIVRWRPDGTRIFTNRAYCRYLGKSAQEVRGTNVFDDIVEADREPLWRTLSTLSPDFPVAKTHERKMQGENRIAWQEWMERGIFDEQGRLFEIQSVGRDITELKKAEAEKEAAEVKLRQAQKIEAIGTLAGGIAHDFNNLLMGIQGRASLVLVDLKPSHPYHEHIKAIEEYIRSATDLTKQLLGFARGGKYEVKSIDINETLRDSAGMFGRTRKEIMIHYKLTPSPVVVEADRGQIEQVLLNIYVNAWQAMPDGGELYLESKSVSLDGDYCRPYQIEPGDYAKVSVTDTGIGMNKAVRERVFDPFFTTKGMSRGTGLGLASAYGIIQNHGGVITVYSEVGHGTTFNIYLRTSEGQVRQDIDLKQDILKGSETILLVDDEEMIIDVGTAMLEKLGYRVVVATHGEEAIATLEKVGEKIGLVILDLIMPGMDGGKTFDRIREGQPELPVILSSGYAINGQATEVMQRGCNGFIQKPFNISELSQKLREALDDDAESNGTKER